MTKPKTGRVDHPFKRILKAYGITIGMVATYLGNTYPYTHKMLRGEKPMSKPAEWKLQKLVDRLRNPVFTDDQEAVNLIP